MKSSVTLDPIGALAAINPVPAETVAALAQAPDFNRTHARIRSRLAEPTSAALPTATRRRLAIALVSIVALSVPALAISGQLGDLFGFSTVGMPTDASKVDLRFASAVDAIGAGSEVRLLDSRNGVSFYVARSHDGALCLAVTSAAAQAPSGIAAGFGCMPSATAKRFPTPASPVWSMTTYKSPPWGGKSIVYVARLAGFAADGVARVEIVGESGDVIAAADVAKNVFVATDIPEVPISAIVARDADGNEVWRETHGRRQ